MERGGWDGQRAVLTRHAVSSPLDSAGGAADAVVRCSALECGAVLRSNRVWCCAAER